MGRAFQSPFAKPPGRGLSSSTVNALWGWLNLIIGWALLFHVGSFDLRRLDGFAALAIGILFCSVFNARNFGRWNGGNTPPAWQVVEEVGMRKIDKAASG
jgi:hypothetical protein